VLIACFLVIHGADLYTKNLKGLQPIGLCPDPNLVRILEKYAEEFQRYEHTIQIFVVSFCYKSSPYAIFSGVAIYGLVWKVVNLKST